MAVILCYGDSNTHGTVPMLQRGGDARFARRARWPDVLGRELGPSHQVIAEGLPGRTTVHEDAVEGGMRNGLAVLPAVLHSHKPLDMVVVMLGTNDLKNRFSVTALEIARSVGRLAVCVRAELPGTDVMLVAPAPVRETGSLAEVFEGAERRQVGIEGHLRDLAEELGCGFVEAGRHVAVSPVDGVHWEDAAHEVFGTALATCVADRLR